MTQADDGRVTFQTLTRELGEWNVAAVSANEVISRRLFVILRGDAEAGAELQRAISEKLAFCARWSWIMFAGGWLELDRSILCMAGEMRAHISANRERLSTL